MSQMVTSKDGTKIAYDRRGIGPTVIFVDGALGWRSLPNNSLNRLAKLLAFDFTVINYDRRGRGESTDTKPYAVEREVEDIEALIDAVGDSAFVFGISSGAALAMEAAINLESKVKKLAMYEPPYNSEEGAMQRSKEYNRQLKQLLAADRRDDAVALFVQLTGATADQINELRLTPMWGMLEALAPTLAYDAAVMGEESDVPVEKAAKVTVPTLIIVGGSSYKFMQETAATLAKAIPHAQYRILEGQTHDPTPDVLAPVLATFFKS